MTRLSERLDPARIQSVLLLVARRLVVMLENLSCCSEGGAGLAAAVELIAAHHAAAPDVALDAFRILVKSLTQNLSGTTTGTNEELQLAVSKVFNEMRRAKHTIVPVVWVVCTSLFISSVLCAFDYARH